MMLPGQGSPPAAARGNPGRIPSPHSVAFPRFHDLLHLQGKAGHHGVPQCPHPPTPHPTTVVRPPRRAFPPCCRVDLSLDPRVRTGMSGSRRFCSSRALSSAGASRASLNSRTIGAATSATGLSSTACEHQSWAWASGVTWLAARHPLAGFLRPDPSAPSARVPLLPTHRAHASPAPGRQDEIGLVHAKLVTAQ